MKDDVIRRVRKLQRLAASSSKHEADAARTRADALIAEHDLTKADLAIVNVEACAFDPELRETWRGEIMRALSSRYGCPCGIFAGKLVFRGKPDLAEEAAHVFCDVTAKILIACATAWQSFQVIDKEAWAVWSTYFCEYAAAGVIDRILKELKPADDTDSVNARKVSRDHSKAEEDARKLIANLYAKFDYALNDKREALDATEALVRKATLQGQSAGLTLDVPEAGLKMLGACETCEAARVEMAAREKVVSERERTHDVQGRLVAELRSSLAAAEAERERLRLRLANLERDRFTDAPRSEPEQEPKPKPFSLLEVE